ncbi:MAG TPA: SPOR domain-containing protein [Vicinamibacterales bacterium]|nr:SPOR domain-containing protein [Vicinamibacterales bacterium]
MSDESTREIQLSGKQLIFLFMSAIVLLVVVFLLGVSVGRGVTSEGVAAGGPVAPAPADAAMPVDAPAAGDTPVDLRYPAELTGRSGRTGAPPPAPSDEVPPIRPPAQPQVAESVPPMPDPASPPPPTTPPAAAPAPAPATPAASGWYVQVGAYRSRESADKVVTDLSGLGHKAFVSPSGGFNRVRVGPFADRPAADRAAAEIARAGHPDPRVVREGP